MYFRGQAGYSKFYPPEARDYTFSRHLMVAVDGSKESERASEWQGGRTGSTPHRRTVCIRFNSPASSLCLFPMRLRKLPSYTSQRLHFACVNSDFDSWPSDSSYMLGCRWWWLLQVFHILIAFVLLFVCSQRIKQRRRAAEKQLNLQVARPRGIRAEEQPEYDSTFDCTHVCMSACLGLSRYSGC